jgi:hypothetical protein
MDSNLGGGDGEGRDSCLMYHTRSMAWGAGGARRKLVESGSEILSE